MTDTLFEYLYTTAPTPAITSSVDLPGKVVRILKKESLRDVTLQKGVENIRIFARFWSCWENPSKSLRAAEKSQGAAEKNKEKIWS